MNRQDDYLSGVDFDQVKPAKDPQALALLQALNTRRWLTSKGLSEDVAQMFGAVPNPQTFEGGAAKGLSEAVSGTANTFLHPIETAQGLYNLDKQLTEYGYGKAAIEGLDKLSQNLSNPAFWGQVAGALAPNLIAEVGNIRDLPPPPHNTEAFAGGYGQHTLPKEQTATHDDIAHQMEVWHGGGTKYEPTADNEFGEIDLSRAGSATGLAHGWGFYTSAAPETTLNYVPGQSKLYFTDEKGNLIRKKYDKLEQHFIRETLNSLINEHGDFDYLLKDNPSFVEDFMKQNFLPSNKWMAQELKDGYLKAAKEIDQHKITNIETVVGKKGYRYTIDIPDEKVPYFLSENDTLEYQSPQVYKILQNLGLDDLSDIVDTKSRSYMRGLLDDLGSKFHKSRYYDAFMENMGVIFDPNKSPREKFLAYKENIDIYPYAKSGKSNTFVRNTIPLHKKASDFLYIMRSASEDAGPLTGQTLYSFLEHEKGSAKGASLYLLKNGIPGIVYRDYHSKNVVTNYVIFDGKMVKILDRQDLDYDYGDPIPPPYRKPE